MFCSTKKLQEELRLLEKRFSNDHPRFRIKNRTVDLVKMEFVQMDEVVHSITAYILDDESTIVWSSESDKVVPVLSELTETNPKMGVIDQFHKLISKLCETFFCPLPSELEAFEPISYESGDESDDSFEKLENEYGNLSLASFSSVSSLCSSPPSVKDDESESESDHGDENNDDDEDGTSEADRENETIHLSDEEEEETDVPESDEALPPEGRFLLDSLKKISSGPLRKLDRLMAKELRELFLSEEYKAGVYTLYYSRQNSEYRELNVNIFKGYGNKWITDMMPDFTKHMGTDFLWLRLFYNANYPVEQMTITICSSVGFNEKQYILLEMDNWNPSMTTKEVLKQFVNSLVKPKPFHHLPDPWVPRTWGFTPIAFMDGKQYDPRSQPPHGVCPGVGLLNYIVLTFLRHVR